jgi:hypothetical protein
MTGPFYGALAIKRGGMILDSTTPVRNLCNVYTFVSYYYHIAKDFYERLDTQNNVSFPGIEELYMETCPAVHNILKMEKVSDSQLTKAQEHLHIVFWCIVKWIVETMHEIVKNMSDNSSANNIILIIPNFYREIMVDVKCALKRIKKDCHKERDVNECIDEYSMVLDNLMKHFKTIIDAYELLKNQIDKALLEAKAKQVGFVIGIVGAIFGVIGIAIGVIGIIM